MLRQHFLDVDVQHIMKIKLPNQPCEDRILWHYDREGEYSVKSGYNLVVQIRDYEFAVSSRDDSGEWAAVWKLHVSPKVQIFLWRALLNILPTMDKLKSKRVVLDSKCHMSGCLEETVMHALVGCGWAQEVWKS